MARTFKGYASAYSARQDQTCRVRRFQQRSLVADFNGAIEPGRTIESVTWECTSPWITYMEDAAVSAGQRSVSVTVQFNYGGTGAIKAAVTLDDQTQLNYEFFFAVQDCPMYPSATYNSANGPYSLTAAAA